MEEEAGCDDLDQGDNGWKIIHTDVFRFPLYKSLLCAVLGVGAQFLTLATGKGFFFFLVLTRLSILSKSQSGSASIVCHLFAIIHSLFLCSNYRHGIDGNVQCASSRCHQLSSNRPLCSDKLCVRICLLLLLHADQRPTMGVEHYPHLITLLW